MHVMTTAALVSETSDQPLTATNAIGGCGRVNDDDTMETDVLTSSTDDDVSASVDDVAQGQSNLSSSNDSGWLSQVLNQLWCQLGFSEVNNSVDGSGRSGDVCDMRSAGSVGVSSGDNVVNHLMSNNDVMSVLQNTTRDSGQTPADNYCSHHDPTLMSCNNFTLDCNHQTAMSSYASEQFSKTLFDDLGGPGSALYADTASSSISGKHEYNSYDFKSLSSMSDDDFDLFDERFFTNDSLNDVMEFPVSQCAENEENEAAMMLEKWFAENLDSLFVEQLSAGSLTGNDGTSSTCSDLTSTAERYLSSSPHWFETGSIYSNETNTSSGQLSRQSSFCSTISGSQPDDECAVIAGNTSSISAVNGATPSGNLSSLRSGGKAVKEQTTARHASFGSPRDWHRYRLRRSSSNVSRRRKVSGQEGSSRSSTPGSSSDLPLPLSNRGPFDIGQSTARSDRPLTRHYSFGSSGYDSVGPRTPDDDCDELSTCKYGDSEFLRLLLDQKSPKIDSSDRNKCKKSSVDDDSDSGLGRSRRFENEGVSSYAGLHSLCSRQQSRRSGSQPVISLVPPIPPLNGPPMTSELEVKRRTLQTSLSGLIGKAGNGFSSRRRVLEDHCYFVRALQSDPVAVIRTAGMSKRKRRSSAPEDQSARLQGLKVSPLLSVLLNAQQSRKTRTKSQVSSGDEQIANTSSHAGCHSYLELFLRSTGPLSANQGSDLIVSEKLGQLRVGVSNRAREPATLSRTTTSGRRIPHCQTSTHRSASKSGKDVILSDIGAEQPAVGSQPRLLHRLLTESPTRDETSVCLSADDAIGYQFDTMCSDYQQTLDDSTTIGIFGDVIASPCAGNVDPLPGMFDSVQMESLDDTSRTDSDWWATCLGYCP